jgi:PAS domain S-box-containing protein
VCYIYVNFLSSTAAACIFGMTPRERERAGLGCFALGPGFGLCVPTRILADLQTPDPLDEEPRPARGPVAAGRRLERLFGRERRRSLAVGAILFSVAVLGVGGGIITGVYRAALERERVHLTYLVDTQAHLLEWVARRDEAVNADGRDGAIAGVLSQIATGDHSDYTGFGKTGEFAVGRSDGERIVFAVPGRDGQPIASAPLHGDTAEPMRRALAGESGVMVGRDYRGQRVLAAYRPVAGSGLGLVAKMELQEVRAPLLRAAYGVAGFWLLVVALGAALYGWVSDRLQRELTRSRHHYQALFDGSELGMLLIEAGRIVRANPRACEMLGREAEALVDGSLVDFSSPRQPDGRDSAVAARQVLDEAKAGRRQVFDWQLARADGSPIDVELALTAVDLADRRRMQVSLRDVTAEKEAEAQRNRLAVAIEQLEEGILISDPDGKVQYVNRAFERITGYAAEEVRGVTTRLLRSGHQDEAFYADLWRTIKAGEVWTGQLVNRKRDGSFYEEEMTISPVFDAAGEIVSYAAVKRDVTQQKLLEAQFLQAQKMEAVGRLAAGVAHDFNNVLTGILGHAELLLLDAPEGEPVEDLKQIVELSKRAADLTRQLLAFSRRQPQERRNVDIDGWIQGTLGMLRRVIGEDVSVELMLGAQEAQVRADEAQLLQLLMNLAVNARDAMPGGGRLEIATLVVDEAGGPGSPVGLRPGRYVCLRVSDTGQGMDAATLERIFEPFYTTKEAGKGTGLGLSTVYGIAQQHGGAVTVTSRPGHGATFTAYLPQAEPESQPAAEALPDAASPAVHATILLVEDDAAVRRVIERTLTGADYDVLTAATPAEARQVLDSLAEPVDLMVTDFVMPGGTGAELYEDVVAKHSGLHVLFISGYAELPQLPSLTTQPRPHFLGKPFTPEELLRQVGSILRPAVW